MTWGVAVSEMVAVSRRSIPVTVPAFGRVTVQPVAVLLSVSIRGEVMDLRPDGEPSKKTNATATSQRTVKTHDPTSIYGELSSIPPRLVFSKIKGRYGP